MNAKRQAEIKRTITALSAPLSEWTDGFFLLAFTPKGEVISCAKTPDAKTTLALNSMMAGIVAHGGLTFVPVEESHVSDDPDGE